jgi:hypothetical protein
MSRRKGDSRQNDQRVIEQELIIREIEFRKQDERFKEAMQRAGYELIEINREGTTWRYGPKSGTTS